LQHVAAAASTEVAFAVVAKTYYPWPSEDPSFPSLPCYHHHHHHRLRRHPYPVKTAVPAYSDSNLDVAQVTKMI
jgi:hypothetical protein